MTVHSCFVEDGSGTKVEILNEDGCAVDKFILNNLDYQSPLMAGKEAHAFKFADKVFVNFQCSIRLNIKDGECKVKNFNWSLSVSENYAVCFQRPVCPALRKRRGELSPFDRMINDTQERMPFADIDVRSRIINVIDPLIGKISVRNILCVQSST